MLGRSRLSEKVILLTILFVMLAEAVIFIPSVAAFRQDWLNERATDAGLIVQAIQGVPNYEGSEALAKTFMETSGVELVAADTDGRSELILGMPDPDMVILHTYDLRDPPRVPPILPALATLFMNREGCIRVIGNSPISENSRVEYIVPISELRSDMWAYFRNIFALSILIALITGVLIYLALRSLIVRPVTRLAGELEAFREDPLTQRSFSPPSRRDDELGDLQREFRTMKREVRASFAQRDRLATLGLAVAKINHDLRNILNVAQLVSDRLASDPDDRVRKMGSRLERVIDRGIRICQETLDYTKKQEGSVEREPIRIASFLGEIAADVLAEFEGLRFRNDVPTRLTVIADPDKTYRLFHNLFRNAGQAMDAMEAARPRELHVATDDIGGMAYITVRDTGPGLPQNTRDNLFTPFASASGAGSTGLGLSISKDLATAQGGSLELVQSDETGTVFRVGLPLKSAQALVAE